jgi:hypothetical protein
MPSYWYFLLPAEVAEYAEKKTIVFICCLRDFCGQIFPKYPATRSPLLAVNTIFIKNLLSMFLKLLRAALVLICSQLTVTVNAQFNLQWEKIIGEDDSLAVFKDITCVKEIKGRELIAYTVHIHDKDYPGISSLSEDNKLATLNDLSKNRGLENFRIVDFAVDEGDTITAYCNDYNQYNDTLPVPRPAEMRFLLQPNNYFKLIDYYDEAMEKLEGVLSSTYSSIYRVSDKRILLGLAFHSANADYVNLFEIVNEEIKGMVTFPKASGIHIWWADDKEALVSTETYFSTGGNTYYEVMVLDSTLQTVRKYPEVLDYLKPEGTDRLISIDYRPDYHLGFLNRQVFSIGKQNYLNCFLFNGYPNGFHNKMVGENENVVIGATTLHSNNNRVEATYSWSGSGVNNWVVSVDTTATGRYNQLIFSIETYTGLIKTQLRLGDSESAEMPDLDLQHDGMGALNPFYSSVKSFSRPDESIYIVTHTIPGIGRRGGLNISSWKLNMEDERLKVDYLTKKYGREIYADVTGLDKATIKEELTLVYIDESDPNFSESGQLLNKVIELDDKLEPVPNTWFWKGDVKIGRKKYTFTKIVIAKAGK